MIYYLLPFSLWLSLTTWKTLCTTTRLSLAHYVFVIPLILVAVLRGEVGPDTATYIRNAQDVLWWGDRSSANEIGYDVLLRALGLLTGNPRVVIALITLLATVLFFVMLQMWGGPHGLLSWVLIPFCYFDFTMNGLRMGIAFPLAVLSIVQLDRKRHVLFYLLVIASLSLQMTTGVLLVLLCMARWGFAVSLKQVMLALLTGLSVLYPAYYIFEDRIAHKLFSYSIMSSPTSLSGVGPLLISSCAALLALWICERRHRFLGIAFLAVQLACFKLSSFTYAGLRFQDMALFAQLLSLSYWMIWPLRRRQIAAVLLLGCIACSWTARNFIVTAGGPSAFLPYHFVWESQ